MGSLPLHPAIVHVPLGLAFIMPLLAAALLAVFWKDRLPRRTWGLVVAAQGLLVVAGLVAMRTGAREESRVERVVSERAIGTHEEAAEVFVWTAGGVLGLAALVLALPAGVRRTGALVVTVAMAGVAGLGVRTGHAGGTLVYAHNAGAAYASAGGSVVGVPAGGSEAGRESDRDDR